MAVWAPYVSTAGAGRCARTRQETSGRQRTRPRGKESYRLFAETPAHCRYSGDASRPTKQRREPFPAGQSQRIRFLLRDRSFAVRILAPQASWETYKSRCRRRHGRFVRCHTGIRTSENNGPGAKACRTYTIHRTTQRAGRRNRRPISHWWPTRRTPARSSWSSGRERAACSEQARHIGSSIGGTDSLQRGSSPRAGQARKLSPSRDETATPPAIAAGGPGVDARTCRRLSSDGGGRTYATLYKTWKHVIASTTTSWARNPDLGRRADLRIEAFDPMSGAARNIGPHRAHRNRRRRTSRASIAWKTFPHTGSTGKCGYRAAVKY